MGVGRGTESAARMKEAEFPAPPSFTHPAFIECLLCAQPSDRCSGCQEVATASGSGGRVAGMGPRNLVGLRASDLLGGPPH